MFCVFIWYFLFAFTDANCPRLPTNQAITIPLTLPGLEVSQLLLDLRTAHIIDWRSVGFIHDSSVGENLIKQMKELFIIHQIHSYIVFTN